MHKYKRFWISDGHFWLTRRYRRRKCTFGKSKEQANMATDLNSKRKEEEVLVLPQQNLVAYTWDQTIRKLNHRRWWKSGKSTIKISRPSSGQFYNTNMGGLDLDNQLLALYLLRRINRRWWFRQLMHFVDVSVVNAWVLSRRGNNTKMDILEFKSSVGRGLITMEIKKENRRGRPRLLPLLVNSRKKESIHHTRDGTLTDDSGHWSKLIDIKNTRRCHWTTCKSKTKYICKKSNQPCLLGLHVVFSYKLLEMSYIINNNNRLYLTN